MEHRGNGIFVRLWHKTIHPRSELLAREELLLMLAASTQGRNALPLSFCSWSRSEVRALSWWPAPFPFCPGRKIGLIQRDTLQKAVAAPNVGGIGRLPGSTLAVKPLGAAPLLPVVFRKNRALSSPPECTPVGCRKDVEVL